MTSHRYVILDVFTDAPLDGNALAVFPDGDRVPEQLMQRLARELNLSETVFALHGDEGADARIRIFTPAAELPFAGHPVLGSAFVVAERAGQEVVHLRTGAGVVPVSLSRPGFGEMEQPIPVVEEFDRAQPLLRALGVERSVLPVQAYRNGPLHVYVGLEDEAAVAALRPDLTALADLGELGVGCFAGTDGRFKSRNVAPGLGVPEDPATGSAAGPLALHLARHGRIGWGEQIEIRQGAEIGRPSLLRARVDGARDQIVRVVVGGSAVVVARGEFDL
jgi:trans-2,3-dihydro-3-hydroxyanthranilate isomerase